MASELDKAILDLLLESALSSSSADLGNEQLPVPLPCQDPPVARGSAGLAVSAADKWRRDLTAIFLTEKSMCLVPGRYDAHRAAFSEAGT